MKFILSKNNSVQISGYTDEFVFLNNVLNEASSSISASDISAIIGITKPEFSHLNSLLLSLSTRKKDETNKNDHIKIRISFDSLIAINNSLNWICNGIYLEDFEKVTGLSKDKAREELSRTNEFIKSSKKEKESHQIISRKKCVLKNNHGELSVYLRKLDWSIKRLGVLIVFSSINRSIDIKSKAHSVDIETLRNLSDFFKSYSKDKNKNSLLESFYIQDFISIYLSTYSDLKSNIEIRIELISKPDLNSNEVVSAHNLLSTENELDKFSGDIKNALDLLTKTSKVGS